MKRVRFVINTIEEEESVCKIAKNNVDFYISQRIVFTLPSKTIEEEYDLSRSEDFNSHLEKWWSEDDEEFIEKLLVFFNKPLNTAFVVSLSIYCVLGLYTNKENIITINNCIKDIDFDPIRIIKHEITHILVEPFIEKYSIGYSEKEEIVNKVLKIISESQNSVGKIS
jgi:hypothetical protein